MRPIPKAKSRGKNKGRVAKPNFLVFAVLVVLFVTFGLLAGPSIGDWLSDRYASFAEPDPNPVPAPAITIEALQDQLETLAARLEAVEQQEAPDLSALAARLQELETQVTSAASDGAPLEIVPDPATAETRALVEVLEARLAALEARKGDPAGGQSLALVAALLAQRAEAGRSYRVEMLRLEAMFPGLSGTDRQEAAALVERLRPHARLGIVSNQRIRLAFTPLIYETLTASGRYGDESEWVKIWAEISSLVVVRRTGQVEGDGLEARLARAELRLESDDLDRAVAEVAAIEDAPRAPLERWLADARARLEVIEAARALELLIDEASRAKE